MMDYIISKGATIVRDKKGNIRFAGSDTEAIQWAIDRADSDYRKWYRRVLRWFGFGGGSIINLDAPRFDITETLNMGHGVELRGSETSTRNDNG